MAVGFGSRFCDSVPDRSDSSRSAGPRARLRRSPCHPRTTARRHMKDSLTNAATFAQLERWRHHRDVGWL